MQKAYWVKNLLKSTKAFFLLQFYIAYSICLKVDPRVLSKYHMKCCLMSTDFPSSLSSSDLTVKTGQVIGTIKVPLRYNYPL